MQFASVVKKKVFEMSPEKKFCFFSLASMKSKGSN